MSADRKIYILCGGQSRRMGSDKALLKLNGESLLMHQIKKANNYFDEVVLLSGRKNYPVNLRQLKDDFEDAGPLAGLLKALKDGTDYSLSHIAIIAVDFPNVTEQTLKKITDSTPADSEDAVLLNSGDDLQPLAGVYKTNMVEKLEQYLSAGNRMVFGFANKLNCSVIEVDAKELKNVNRPDDLESIF